MQMNILRAVAMTTVGNAAFARRDVSAFVRSALWRFTKAVEFVVPRGDQRETVAGDVAQWFDWLKAGGCQGLRLHTAPMEQKPGRLGHIEERMLVGFVGGGPRWLIETAGAGGAQLWEAFDRVGDPNDPEHRIWRTAVVRMADTAAQTNADDNVKASIAELDGVLADIIAVARQLQNSTFTSIFEQARDALQGEAPEYQPLDFLDLTDLDAEARRLLQVSHEAWVFGGMGSWNDIVPEPSLKPEYERASEALFLALQRALIAVANSSYRG